SAREVEAVEQVALAEEVALGRVDVLRAERVVVVEAPRLEAAGTTAHVGEREEEAPGEVVVAASVRQARPGDLVAREPLLEGAAGERGAARGEAETELAADLLPQPARREVVAREGARLRFPQVALVERRRPVEQLEQPLAPLSQPVLLRRRLLVLELDAEAVGQPLDRADEVDVLQLLDECDRVAALAAAEALEGAAVGRDAEARRLLLVERTQPRVAAAGLPEPRVALDQRDEIGRALDGLDRGVLDPRHQRLAAYASAKRSVIPATYSTISSGVSPRSTRCATIRSIVSCARRCSLRE